MNSYDNPYDKAVLAWSSYWGDTSERPTGRTSLAPAPPPRRWGEWRRWRRWRRRRRRRV